MQYSCQAFQELLRRHALVPSMSRKGDCWDNAVAESFFSHLKARVIEGRSFRDERELRRVVFEYTGLTQNQNLRGHHAAPFFTDAAIVE